MRACALGYRLSVGAPEPDASRPAPLRGLRRHAAVFWVIAIVVLYTAAQLGLPVVR